MAPRGHTLPQATTESAKEARKAFFCELCQKGYARMNEFEAHEGSYDHQHRKRLKEMKQLSKDSNTIARARAAEDRESNDLKSISLPRGKLGATGLKKKPVFISTAQSSTITPVPARPVDPVTSTTREEKPDATYELDLSVDGDDLDRAKYNGWLDDRYDPLCYTTSDQNSFLRANRGRPCATGCVLCRGEKPVTILNADEIWDEKKHDQLLRLMGERGEL